MKKSIKHLIVSLMVMGFVVLLGNPVFALSGGKVRRGSLKGTLVDKYTRTPVPGATVRIAGTKHVTLTNDEGGFSFSAVDVGSYTVTFELPELPVLSRPDINVRSKRITFMDVDIDVNPVVSEEVTVNPGYFSQSETTEPGSKTSFSFEEIRRTAGSAGDVSRIVRGLPAIAKVNDYANSLIVRGGSPAENIFIVDNIEIPNINHFPIQGSSGGPIGLLNTDFIKDVSFYSGGFSAQYGGKLSSVMDIQFREGNREEFDLQFDLNFTGIGAAVEGPLADKGSWLFSIRRSYVDIIAGISDDINITPSYSDFQGKLTYELSPRSKLTFLGIMGVDDNDFDQEAAVEDGNNYYGETHNREGTFGLNWFWIWSDKGYSETSFSYQFTKYNDEFYDVLTRFQELDNRSKETSFNIRNVSHYTFNHAHRLDFGFDARRIETDYDYRLASRIDPMGNQRPEIANSTELQTEKLGAFVNYGFSPMGALTFNLGVRGDYFGVNKNFHISPRVSVSWDLSGKSRVYASTGLYYQHLPLLLLSQAEENKKLKDPRAYHYTLGFSHLLSDDTRLTVEAYQKDYHDMPLDPMEPQLFVVDRVLDYNDIFAERSGMVDTGRARSRGIEFILQKKLKEKIYGMISGAYTLSEYRDLGGTWRDRSYDNRFIFTAEGGYKPNKNWEFSLKWIYAGGRPYTPFDIEASRAFNSGILDNNRVNSERLPAYHSLNLRLDKRFYFKGSNLIIYLSIWNAYNQNNIAGYYWNVTENKQDEIKQFGMMPILGIEFEL